MVSQSRVTTPRCKAMTTAWYGRYRRPKMWKSTRNSISGTVDQCPLWGLRIADGLLRLRLTRNAHSSRKNH